MSPLDRKLLRDLWRMKGQATAIGAVIAMGVMILVMMNGLVASLTETKTAYYDRYRLADVFASVGVAPDRLAARLAKIAGVSTVETRVVGRALIDFPGVAFPVQARAVSLPVHRRPALNDVYLTHGRMPQSGRPSEVLLLQSFAAARGLRPGDSLSATMNGARYSFDIVGLAQSPEFLYTTAPGELVPDDARFGVIWMRRTGLSAAYNMSGAFNEALFDLQHGASEPAVLSAIDNVLEGYGGTGAYSLSDQFSNTFVTQEIEGLKATAVGVPPVFLSVAAFLLYIVIGRLVRAEREEIGLMKAFGYTNAEVGGHYFKLILLIATGGALVGCLGGIATGRALIGLYTTYFKFPFLVFQLDPGSFAIGVATSIVAASAGGFFVLRRVFMLTPAVAMRPPAPPNYGRTGQIGKRLSRFLDQPSRMVLRRITRQPVRMAGSVVGIAAGMSLSVAMITIYAGFDRSIDLSFSVVDRSDIFVSFARPVSDKTLFELAQRPGVHKAEPVRVVNVVLHHGRRNHRVGLIGLPKKPELNRALDKTLAPISLPNKGLVLSEQLAKILNAKPGDTLTVDVRDGRQPRLQIPVSGLAQAFLGSPVYMDLEALNRVLREPRRLSAAYLKTDPAQSDAIFAALQDMPTVAGISNKSQARDAFTRVLNEGAGSVRYVMGAIAFVITFGIVYNAARIALAERARDLSSLRVIGFSKGETAYVLLGELAVVTLIALPVGAVGGYFLSFAVAAGFSTELYQIPAFFDPAAYGQAALVILGAALVSGWLVKRDLDRIDLVETLKTRG